MNINDLSKEITKELIQAIRKLNLSNHALAVFYFGRNYTEKQYTWINYNLS